MQSKGIQELVTPDRIRSNVELFDFTLSPEQMTVVSGISGGRIGPSPDNFELP